MCEEKSWKTSQRLLIRQICKIVMPKSYFECSASCSHTSFGFLNVNTLDIAIVTSRQWRSAACRKAAVFSSPRPRGGNRDGHPTFFGPQKGPAYSECYGPNSPQHLVQQRKNFISAVSVHFIARWKIGVQTAKYFVVQLFFCCTVWWQLKFYQHYLFGDFFPLFSL